MDIFKSNKTKEELEQNSNEMEETLEEKQEAAPEEESKETTSKEQTASEAQDKKDEPKEVDEVENLKKEIDEQKDKYLRLQAEFDNFRRRTLREKMELIESGGKDVILKILPVLDDMYRATEAASKSDDLEAIRKGETLILQKFLGILEGVGVKEIQTQGEPFNEENCEAVTRLKAGEELSGKVIDVLERGYTLKGKVIRYAKVVVGE
ncbi:MAG: nucleotide exchange factor GrpE [Alistipes sp.]|nr:nucleotide exchange factor GrpE [Candidatus Alistipes equi]